MKNDMNTQPLFNYLNQEFGISPLETEMQEIINIVNLMTIQEQLKDLHNQVNRIEAQLGIATNHNSVADAQRAKPIEPDYSHLLPEGYEFCQEQDAEKWVKVELYKNTEELEQNPIGEFWIGIADKYKPYYRPIRPIKYHVALHEVVTIEPDPYQPDWSKAPEGTVAHAYDVSQLGYWYKVVLIEHIFLQKFENSNNTLPTGLDWKKSLRLNPKLK